MSNQQILEQAIQKAIDGGWKAEIVKGNILKRGHISTTLEAGNWLEPYPFIFNHDFAKALWGENGHTCPDVFNDSTCINCGQKGAGTHSDDSFAEPCWSSHLQQMVLAEDPIKYLGENI